MLYLCYGYINIDEYESIDGVKVIVEFEEVGVYVVVFDDKCMVFIIGYLEYDFEILVDEY